MKFTYSVRVCKDGINRCARVKRTKPELIQSLYERRNIVNRSLNTPCWEWTGAKNKRGYGTIGYLGKYVRINRISYMLFRGIVPRSMEVCHKCDNPKCFNPDHLFLGTHTDNMRDAFSKGRIPIHKGEASGASKLTEKQVRIIRKLYVPFTNSRHTLSKRFNVHGDTVVLAATGKTWSHLK